MRSSNKSRSRNKNTGNRRGNTGNIVNRVFDSSGPDGRVRGTPQQIIEKYQSLARDAQLSGDRIGSENFAQHAEHYARLLGEAQREMNERREAMEAQRKENAQQNQQNQQNQQKQPQPKHQQQPPVEKSSPAAQADAPQPDIGAAQGVAIFPGEENDSSTLVQTPENTAAKPAKAKKPAAPRKKVVEEADGVVVEKPAPKRRKPAGQKPAKVASSPKSEPAVDEQPAVSADPEAPLPEGQASN